MSLRKEKARPGPNIQFEIELMKLSLVAVLLLVCCLSAYSHGSEGVRVGFSFRDTQNLIHHLRNQGYNAEHDDECCQPEEDALGIWIGRQVPFEDVKYIVIQALQAYPRLVYYSYFGDERQGYPESLDHSIYIGGSKWAATCNTSPVEADLALKLFGMMTNSDHLRFFLDSLKLQEAANCAVRAP